MRFKIVILFIAVTIIIVVYGGCRRSCWRMGGWDGLSPGQSNTEWIMLPLIQCTIVSGTATTTTTPNNIGLDEIKQLRCADGIIVVVCHCHHVAGWLASEGELVH
jgi:hypothetical protein